MRDNKEVSSVSSTDSGARHRTAATEKASVPGYPDKLFIFKTEATSYWQVRYYVGGRVVKKSTKQTGKAAAIAFAKEFYDTVTHNFRLGINTTSFANFEVCTRELMKDEKSKYSRGEITKTTYDNMNYRFDKSVLPFFRQYEVGQIDYFLVEKYLHELSEKDLTTSTISAYLRLVHKVLDYAVKRHLITSIPAFPKVRVLDVARGWFTTGEYRTLWGAAKRYVGVKMEVRKYKNKDGETETQYIKSSAKKGKLGDLMRNVEMTEDLRRLVVFMTNSYIRPTDIKFMKHKHVDIVRSEYTYLRLRIPPTKGHSNPITTMPSAVETYLKLKAYHEKKFGSVSAEDYVFLPQYRDNRDYALKQLQRQFEILMWDTNLGEGSDGEQRTLYSLRHTAIMYRLLYGDAINTLALARNARTSVEMIDRFYAKPLTGEMNVGMLQSKRRRHRYFDGDG